MTITPKKSIMLCCAAILSGLAITVALGVSLGLAQVLVLKAAETRPLPAFQAAARAGLFSPLPITLTVTSPGLADSIMAADYLFSKTVMPKEEFDATQSCASSVKALKVRAGALVVYCYRFRNIGTTTFLTLTLTDDKLGTLGLLALSPPFVPNAAGGFLAYAVPIMETTTNYATTTLEDDQGNSIVRTDQATVETLRDVWLPLVFGR